MSPSTPRVRLPLRRALPLVVLGASAALVAGIAPAYAGDIPVTIDVVNANANGRQLALKALDGSANPNLSGAQTGFITNVTDSSYQNKGYTVSATMSKLYKFDGTNYDCNTAIPSNKVTIAEPGLVDLSGVSAALTPVLGLVGSAAGTALPANTTVVGNPQTLSQGTLASAATGVVNANTGNLPVRSVVGGSTPTAFAVPAAAGSGTNCSDTGANATAVPLLVGTQNLGAVQTLLAGTIGTKAGNALSPYASTDQVRGAVTGVLAGVSSTLLASDSLSSVNGSLSAVRNLVQSGLYQVSPAVTIDTSNVATGQYRGVMTVTLADNP